MKINEMTFVEHAEEGLGHMIDLQKTICMYLFLKIKIAAYLHNKKSSVVIGEVMQLQFFNEF